MVAYNKFNAFVENICEGVHNLATGVITYAATAAASAPVATNSVLLDLTTVSLANFDDITPVISSSSQTNGTYTLVLTDQVCTGTGTVPTFRYWVHYNDTPTSPADPLICWHDYGSNVDIATSETFTVDYGTELFSLT